MTVKMSHVTLVLTAALCWCVQALQPHVRVWDSVSLSTLQVIGLGTFERGVGSLAFSKAVSIDQVHHGNCVQRHRFSSCVSVVPLPGLWPAPERR